MSTTPGGTYAAVGTSGDSEEHRGGDPSSVILGVELVLVVVLYAVGVDSYGGLTSYVQSDPSAQAHGKGLAVCGACAGSRSRLRVACGVHAGVGK
jgi:hypothetical protein